MNHMDFFFFFLSNMKEVCFQAGDILIYGLFVPLTCSLLQTRSVPLERGKKSVSGSLAPCSAV